MPNLHRPFAVLGVALVAIMGLALPSRADEDEAMEEKLGPIIECINNADNPLQGNFDKYRRLVEEIKKDPKAGHLTFLNGFDTDSNYIGAKVWKQCADTFDEAAGIAPRIGDLDQAVKHYATAIRAFIPLAPEVDNYYKQEDYKDDKWAKGKALDEKLAPLMAQIEIASGGIRKAVLRETNAIRDRELTQVEAKSGKGFEWHTLHYMIEARKTQEAFAAVMESDKPSAAEFGKAIEPLQKAYDDAVAYAGAHEEELKPTPGGHLPGWAYIKLYARDYLAKAKDLRRKLEGDNPNPSLINSTAESLVHTYNGLVDGYNQRGN
ncbi:MAG TPA: DUF3829 domain-containing protein [Stellaceae bacterium]|nr:DUF3829 domain-containing protein [Stellaceae bacterium]